MTGRVAIVTGASAGIGLAVARELLDAGLRVLVNGRDPARLAAAAAALDPGEERVLPVAGDVTDPATPGLLAARALERFGRIDVLVNNAGGGTDTQRIEAIDDAEWDAVVDLNLRATFATCRAVMPVMRGAGYGRIVNVTSVAGRSRGRLSGPSYSAAKAGVHGLTRHLATEAGPDGITVNAVAPGFVRTERALRKWDARTADERDRMLDATPIRRFGEPEEIAHAVAFLASERAAYITGACLDVNGGGFMC